MANAVHASAPPPHECAVVVVVVQHDRHADEERRQKRENKSLQEGHEQLQQVDRYAGEHHRTPTPSPRPVLTAPADMMNESRTASRMWPAIMLAKSRTASAKTFAMSPMISTGTRSGANHNGPGQKCARYAVPPRRNPFTTIITIVSTREWRSPRCCRWRCRRDAGGRATTRRESAAGRGYSRSARRRTRSRCT